MLPLLTESNHHLSKPDLDEERSLRSTTERTSRIRACVLAQRTGGQFVISTAAKLPQPNSVFTELLSNDLRMRLASEVLNWILSPRDSQDARPYRITAPVHGPARAEGRSASYLARLG